MASKSVSIGDWKIETLTDEDVKDLLALIRQAKNDNLDDEYAYKSYNRLETKIYRIALALREVADRLCTDLGELQCPIEVLREIADEVEAL